MSTPTMRGGLDLLVLAYDAALVGRHAVDAGLSTGDHRVADPLALTGPAGHGSRGAELHVVRVRDDAQRALPGLVEGLRGVRVCPWSNASGAASLE